MSSFALDRTNSVTPLQNPPSSLESPPYSADVMRDEESLSDDETSFPDDKLLLKTKIIEGEPQEVSTAPFPFAIIQAVIGIGASIIVVVLISIIIAGHNIWPSKSGCELSRHSMHLYNIQIERS
jgi:hypothetical protein